MTDPEAGPGMSDFPRRGVSAATSGSLTTPGTQSANGKVPRSQNMLPLRNRSPTTLGRKTCNAATSILILIVLLPAASGKRNDDVVVMKNGDRITGEIKSLEEGKL